MNGAPSALRRWPACCSSAYASAARVLGSRVTRSPKLRPPVTKVASVIARAISGENLYYICTTTLTRAGGLERLRGRGDLGLGLWLRNRGRGHLHAGRGVRRGPVERLGHQ